MARTLPRRMTPESVVVALFAALAAGQLVAALAPRPALDRSALVPVTETADARAAEAAWAAAHPEPGRR